eukprot:g2786.t1
MKKMLEEKEKEGEAIDVSILADGEWNSPILEDLKSLKEIPENKVLSPSELKQHREDVSVLLEKAMSSATNSMKEVEHLNKHLIESSKTLKPKEIAIRTIIGFIDGITQGLVRDISSKWDDTCTGGFKDVKSSLEKVTIAAKKWGHALLKIHKKIWTKEGRHHIKESTVKFYKALENMIVVILKFVSKCNATKMIGFLVLIIGGAIALNLAIIALGGVLLPLLIKIASVIMAAAASGAYLYKKIKSIHKSIKCMGKHDCKLQLIEDVAAIVGSLVDLIVFTMPMAKETIGTLKANPKSTGIMDKFKFEASDQIKQYNEFVKVRAERNKYNALPDPMLDDMLVRGGSHLTLGTIEPLPRTGKVNPKRTGISPPKFTDHPRIEKIKSLPRTGEFKPNPKFGTGEFSGLKLDEKYLSPQLKKVSKVVEALLFKNSAKLIGKVGIGMKTTLLAGTNYVKDDRGECERTTDFLDTCGKDSECRPVQENPCKGKCICDTDGVNECECVVQLDEPSQRRRLLEENKVTFFWNSIKEPVSKVFKPKTKCWKKGSKDRTITFQCKSELAKLGLKEYILTKTSNAGNDQRRRLLSKVRMDWDAAWSGFISNVHSHGDNDGKCKVHTSLSGVNVDTDGSYSFSCSRSPDLCNCISQVGTGSISADTQYFVNQNMGIYLGVFKDGG